jgi:hypothetical protein
MLVLIDSAGWINLWIDPTGSETKRLETLYP